MDIRRVKPSVNIRVFRIVFQFQFLDNLNRIVGEL